MSDSRRGSRHRPQNGDQPFVAAVAPVQVQVPQSQIPEREASLETPQAYEHFDEEMHETESEPDTPPGYYDQRNIPEDYLEPEYEPMPEDDHMPEYEPLPEDEPIPEYEPETPTGEYSEDLTDVELEPQ
ncbi:uncharacterized protein LOC131630695 [Vicia villosa]|uniref:uncharacterized protein LOC131630695 n=1 Tax=Vicia villosa TaxID=3911 RepID=UPI00273B9542|nr:uncharacterized protein LOC131630695 [Vicia villosa]